MRPGTPGFDGRRLRQVREARGLTQKSLAELAYEAAGVSNKSISLYERGESTPHPDAAAGLARVLGVPVEFFLSAPTDADDAPVFWRSMAASTATARARGRRRLEWILQIKDFLASYFDFPRANLPDWNFPSDITAISETAIEDAAERLRARWQLGDGPLANMVHLLENNGAIVASADLVADTLDAFSYWRPSDDRPYVVLGREGRTKSRSRLNAAHELGHLILHRHAPDTILRKGEHFKLAERQAFRFAGAFLLPASTFPDDFLVPQLTTLLVLKEKWGVSAGAMLYRAESLRIIRESDRTRLWRAYSRRRAEDFEPDEHEKPVLLHDAVIELIETGVLTRSQLLNGVCLSAQDVEELLGLVPGYLAHAPQLRFKGVPSDARNQGPSEDAEVIPLFPELYG